MNKLPVMLLKGLVLLPTQEVRLELNNKISKKVVFMAANKYDGNLLVVCPKDQFEESPEVTDLPNIGVVGVVRSKIELPNGNLRVVISGTKRINVLEYLNDTTDKEILLCKTNELELPKYSLVEEKAIVKKLNEVLKKYIKKTPYISNSIISTIKGIEDIDKLTDMLTSFLPMPIEEKIAYMEEINGIKRALSLIENINVELEVIALDEKIDSNLQVELENNQKEFILREKINQIKKELGEENEKDDEINSYYEFLDNTQLSEKTKDKLAKEIKKFEYTSDMSPDLSIIRNYLDWITSLPWNHESTDTDDLNKIKEYLDKTHYGLSKIKDRIIEYIAVKKRNPLIKSPIICLVGPPGVGKTSLGMTIAKSLNKEFYKLSVGGLNDASELVGHRRTYIGASPGKIIQAIRKCGTKNPVILIDEVDKMVHDYKGDPASALLDILDPEQNKIFTDNYIEEPFDLSNVLFILTANNEDAIPSALYDRLEVIELSSYTEFEKCEIATKHLIPKIYKDHNITKKEIKISEPIIMNIINNYTKEAGVRELERELETIVRKIITSAIKDNKDIKINLKKSDLKTYLGNIKYDDLANTKVISYGLVNGLAYTPMGGLVLPIESCIYEGKGNFVVTGMVGKVMDESIKVALSYIKANKDNFKVNDYYFDTKDIHIHMLEGAIPKDGPSAGVTIVTSILSLILKENVSSKIAMTGEISLRGEVLKIGGLKEKIIGAYNEGIKTIFIPLPNEPDLEEIPKEVIDSIKIIPIKTYQEIFDYIFKKKD